MVSFGKIMILGAATTVSMMGMSQGALAQDAEPALVKSVAPSYPRTAERREIEGFVRLKFTVNDAGKVDAVEVVEATPPGVFDKAATSAAEKWVFESGKPYDGLVKKLSFKLVDG